MQVLLFQFGAFHLDGHATQVGYLVDLFTDGFDGGFVRRAAPDLASLPEAFPGPLARSFQVARRGRGFDSITSVTGRKVSVRWCPAHKTSDCGALHQIGDGVKDRRPRSLRKAVSHAVDPHQFGLRNSICGLLTALREDQAVIGAVDHRGRDIH